MRGLPAVVSNLGRKYTTDVSDMVSVNVIYFDLQCQCTGMISESYFTAEFTRSQTYGEHDTISLFTSKLTSVSNYAAS